MEPVGSNRCLASSNRCLTSSNKEAIRINSIVCLILGQDFHELRDEYGAVRDCLTAVPGPKMRKMTVVFACLCVCLRLSVCDMFMLH